MLSAAMSRRARPGGEAGGPRNSQLGCRRRARRRTALLEMGVPPIEQHGGGGGRVGKRKIRFVVGLSKIRKVARCVCAGGGGVGGGGTTGTQRIPPPRKNPREPSRRKHENPAGEPRCSLRRREESKESNRKIHLQKPCFLHWARERTWPNPRTTQTTTPRREQQQHNSQNPELAGAEETRVTAPSSSI